METLGMEEKVSTAIDYSAGGSASTVVAAAAEALERESGGQIAMVIHT